MRSLSDLFRNFVQLGYVTDDIDAAASYLESAVGTGTCVKSYQSSLGGGRLPAGPGDPRAAYVVVDGVLADEWTIDVALVNAGPTNLEIIRPVGGAVGLYRDAVRPGEPATLHHVGFVVDDFDEASAVVAASGRSWKQFGSRRSTPRRAPPPAPERGGEHRKHGARPARGRAGAVNRLRAGYQVADGSSAGSAAEAAALPTAAATTSTAGSASTVNSWMPWPRRSRSTLLRGQPDRQAKGERAARVYNHHRVADRFIFADLRRR